MRVFLLTSVPLVPPWDQGDKNLAYLMTKALPHVDFTILTTPSLSESLGSNLEYVPIFRNSNSILMQKANVYSWFMFQSLFRSHRLRNLRSVGVKIHLPLAASTKPDVYHFIYKPNRFSSLLVKRLQEFKRHPVLHTVPAVSGLLDINKDLFIADRVISISEYGKKMLEAAGVKNVSCILPGIAVDEWEQVGSQSTILKDQAGFANRPVILFPGHYGPGQGSEVMLEALPRVISHYPEALFLFACRLRSKSDGEKEVKAKEIIRLEGCENSVLFYNTVNDMSALIGLSDIVVLPLQTMRDKMDIPITLLEALAAGKPIIISNLAPMNELVAHPPTANEAKSGLLTPPGDAGALSQAILSLLDDPQKRIEMGKNGQEQMRRQHDFRKIACQYEKIYQEMIG